MTSFAFQMALWKLPAKFQTVSLSQKEANPIGRCHLEPDTPYLIEKLERIGLCGLYIMHLVCPPLVTRWRHCLPEHYGLAVRDENIKTANSGRLLHVLVLRSRKDMPCVFDLVVV